MATVPRPPIIYAWRQLSRHAALGTHDTNSFQLPQQQRLPPGKASFDLPVIAKRNPQDWQNSFALPQQQRLPPGKSSFDLPVLAKRNPQDWQDTFDLPQQQRLPPGKASYDSPVLAKRNPQDWVVSSPIVLLTGAVVAAAPLRPVDWPVPRSQSRNLADWTSYLLPWSQAPPNRQNDWPNPLLAPARTTALGHSDSFKLPLQQVIQPNQYDWPNPRAPKPLVVDWSDSFKLPLQQVIQPNQYDWPNPPLAARRNPQEWTSFAPPALQPATQPPFRQTDWAVPATARRNPQDWQNWFGLPQQQVLPPGQTEWPNPRSVRAPVQDWIISARLTLTTFGTPFFQADWPLPPKGKVGVLQTWSDSFKLPQQQTLPPRQLDWPVPRSSVSYDLRGFTQRSVIVAPAPAKPINQYDWPNPRGPHQPVVTVREFIHGVVPPVPPVFDSTRTLKNEVIRLRYLNNASSRVRFLKNEVRS